MHSVAELFLSLRALDGGGSGGLQNNVLCSPCFRGYMRYVLKT